MRALPRDLRWGLPWDLPALVVDPPAFLVRRATAAGPVARLRLGRRPAYLVTGPAEVHGILTSQHEFPKGLAHDFGGPEPGPPLAVAFGNGLLSSQGAHHARQRRLMQPAFGPKSVASYGDRIADQAAQLTASWSDGAHVDLTEALSETTLHILTRTIFDTPLPPADVHAIRSAVTAGQRLAGVRGLVRTRTPEGLARVAALARAAMDPANAVIARLVAERLEQPARDDILSVLLDSVDADTGERMSARDVQDEVLTLLMAGHETTTNALSWVFALLSRHPLAESRLHAEVDQAHLASAPELPDPLALARLPWTTACLDEGLRLYPPAWLILRHTDQPARIGGLEIPAGSTLVLSPIATQRIPALWPDAERFRPERFAPGGGHHPERRRPLTAFFPFGGGPRLCIGEHFALLEARIVLATVARRWRVRLVARRFPAYRPRITLGPRGGLTVQVWRR